MIDDQKPTAQMAEQFRELQGKCQRIQENRDFWHGVAEKLREELFEAREEQATKIAALRAAPERELYEASRAFYNTISTIAVVVDLKASLPESWKLVESTGRRLCVALINQHSVAVVADSSEVVSSPALGAHEVHPQAIDSGLDLAETGERLVAADALEHASGVLQECDGSATAPTGFVMVPVELTENAIEAICMAHGHGVWPEGYGEEARALRRAAARNGYFAALATRPQVAK